MTISLHGQATNDIEFSQSLEGFGNNLYYQLVKSNSHKNIIFSPFSIQSCLAMARLGALGETADQMDRGLNLRSHNTESLANNFHSVLAEYENNNILKIANKMYIMKDFEVQDNFKELLTHKFLSSAENIDFTEKSKAAATINSWVASTTNDRIKNIISSKDLSEKTRLILLNAIHFKGEWKHAFPEYATVNQNFYTSDSNRVMVPMMRLTATFRYGEISSLDATILEMPYKDSDLSMLIILPNARNGLKELRTKLKFTSLQYIIDNLYSTKVIVSMPKFKAEFDVELNGILEKVKNILIYSWGGKKDTLFIPSH